MRVAGTKKMVFLQAAMWLLLADVCYAEARAGTTADLSAQTREFIMRYEDEVKTLQSQFGASDPRLGEILLGLGLAYRHANRHEEAASAFKQGLHIMRINEGLYSLVQLPYLERLIEENTTLGKWKKVNKNYNYLFWVYKRIYGDDDTRLLPVIDRITRSQINIYNADPESFSAANLKKREKMLNKAVQIIETHYGRTDMRLVAALNRVALNQYYLALQSGSMAEYRNYKELMRNAHSGDMFTHIRIPVPLYVNGTVVGVTYREIAVPKTRSSAYLSDRKAQIFKNIDAAKREGRLALARIQAITEQNPQASVYDRALALIHEGDWELLYEDGYGRSKYRQAYELLRQFPEGAAYIDYQFGQPRPLPALEQPQENGKQQARDQATAAGTVIEASFDVLPSGRSRRVHITWTRPGLDTSLSSYIKRYVTGIRFRPRLEDGQPVTTRDVKIKYVVDKLDHITASVQ